MRDLSVTAVLVGLMLGATPSRAAEQATPCALGAAADSGGTVAAILDERTLRLADGREVRLVGLETILDAGDPAQAEAAAIRARTELERLALGQPLAIQPLGVDRYGRQLALAAPAADPTGPTLQERLISSGFALAGARNPDSACLSRFLAAERSARQAGLGLWANPHYLLREAARPDSVARGRFALVQGRVVSVNDRGAIVYVNFGRRWSDDFTVTIVKRNARSFTAAGLDPRTLTGRHVRIRGWVGERGGPWIEAVGPEQIEIVN